MWEVLLCRAREASLPGKGSGTLSLVGGVLVSAVGGATFSAVQGVPSSAVGDVTLSAAGVVTLSTVRGINLSTTGSVTFSAVGGTNLSAGTGVTVSAGGGAIVSAMEGVTCSEVRRVFFLGRELKVACSFGGGGRNVNVATYRRFFVPEPPGQPHHHARPVEAHELDVARDAHRRVLGIVAEQRAQLTFCLWENRRGHTRKQETK